MPFLPGGTAIGMLVAAAPELPAGITCTVLNVHSDSSAFVLPFTVRVVAV